jgi:hypothetical protein
VLAAGQGTRKPPQIWQMWCDIGCKVHDLPLNLHFLRRIRAFQPLHVQALTSGLRLCSRPENKFFNKLELFWLSGIEILVPESQIARLALAKVNHAQFRVTHG